MSNVVLYTIMSMQIDVVPWLYLWPLLWGSVGLHNQSQGTGHKLLHGDDIDAHVDFHIIFAVQHCHSYSTTAKRMQVGVPISMQFWGQDPEIYIVMGPQILGSPNSGVPKFRGPQIQGSPNSGSLKSGSPKSGSPKSGVPISHDHQQRIMSDEHLWYRYEVVCISIDLNFTVVSWISLVATCYSVVFSCMRKNKELDLSLRDRFIVTR